jgi:hypothetical protein
MHLDDATWQRLWKDPASARSMIDHLKEGCDVCDDFIANRPELDGEVDRLLLGLSPREAPLDELGWRRLRTKVFGARRNAPVALIAMAAGLAVVAGASFVAVRGRAMTTIEQTAPGVKGPGHAVMEVLAARQTDSGTFEQLDPGGHVPKGSTLAFRVTSPVDGPARVFLQRGKEQPEELAQVRVKAGANQLEQESGLFGVNLEDEQGRVTVWVVVHEGPFDAERALEAIASGSPPLVVGRVEFLVDP